MSRYVEINRFNCSNDEGEIISFSSVLNGSSNSSFTFCSGFYASRDEYLAAMIENFPDFINQSYHLKRIDYSASSDKSSMLNYDILNTLYKSSELWRRDFLPIAETIKKGELNRDKLIELNTFLKEILTQFKNKNEDETKWVLNVPDDEDMVHNFTAKFTKSRGDDATALYRRFNLFTQNYMRIQNKTLLMDKEFIEELFDFSDSSKYDMSAKTQKAYMEIAKALTIMPLLYDKNLTLDAFSRKDIPSENIGAILTKNNMMLTKKLSQMNIGDRMVDILRSNYPYQIKELTESGYFKSFNIANLSKDSHEENAIKSFIGKVTAKIDDQYLLDFDKNVKISRREYRIKLNECWENIVPVCRTNRTNLRAPVLIRKIDRILNSGGISNDDIKNMFTPPENHLKAGDKLEPYHIVNLSYCQRIQYKKNKLATLNMMVYVKEKFGEHLGDEFFKKWEMESADFRNMVMSKEAEVITQKRQDGIKEERTSFLLPYKNAFIEGYAIDNQIDIQSKPKNGRRRRLSSVGV